MLDWSHIHWINPLKVYSYVEWVSHSGSRVMSVETVTVHLSAQQEEGLTDSLLPQYPPPPSEHYINAADCLNTVSWDKTRWATAKWVNIQTATGKYIDFKPEPFLNLCLSEDSAYSLFSARSKCLIYLQSVCLSLHRDWLHTGPCDETFFLWKQII